MSLEETDKAGQAAADKGGGFRVTLDYMKSEIQQIYYISGTSIARHADFTDYKSKALNEGDLQVMTLCMIMMRNGFMVFGKSSPISPQNFDQALGRKFAYEDAVRQLWPLFAFGHKQAVADGLVDE